MYLYRLTIKRQLFFKGPKRANFQAWLALSGPNKLKHFLFYSFIKKLEWTVRAWSVKTINEVVEHEKIKDEVVHQSSNFYSRFHCALTFKNMTFYHTLINKNPPQKLEFLSSKYTQGFFEPSYQWSWRCIPLKLSLFFIDKIILKIFTLKFPLPFKFLALLSLSSI